METVLNELSITLANSKEEAKGKMLALLNHLKSLNELKFNRLRLPHSSFFEIELSANYTFNDWLNDHTVNRTLRDLFISIVAFPYFEELEEEAIEHYVLSIFTLNEPEHPNNNNQVQGLADAYLRNTLSVSFSAHSVWEKCKISIEISETTKESTLTHVEKVMHASGETCLNQAFKKWYKSRTRPPLNSHIEVDIWFPLTNGFQISDKAKNDLIYWYRQNQMDKLDKLESFFMEIFDTPFEGSGQVEPLKGNLSGWWSRRINQEHRLVYRYEKDILIICSCKGHYERLNC